MNFFSSDKVLSDFIEKAYVRLLEAGYIINSEYIKEIPYGVSLKTGKSEKNLLSAAVYHTEKKGFSVVTTDPEIKSLLLSLITNVGTLGSDEAGKGDVFGPLVVCSFILGEKEQVFVTMMNDSEKAAADLARETAEQNEATCIELNSKIEAANAKIEEFENQIATLNMEAENAQAQYSALEAQNNDAQSQISALTEENESLKAYKKSIELQSKEAVIGEYADKLSEEVLGTYKAKFDEYTPEELDMRLAYELKKSNPSVFSQAPTGFIPKADAPRNGVEEFLSHYRQ